MQSEGNQPYRHQGVFIPYEAADAEWSVSPLLSNQGFYFVDSLRPGYVFCVQSVGTGDILVNKLLEDHEYYDPDMPEEVRISTAPVAISRLPSSFLVDGVERIYFNELLHWQRLPDGTYNLYFRHCNGGTLADLYLKYRERRRPIPEHLVWLTAERLASAIRFFNYGIHPAAPPSYGERPAEDWALISHRDLHMRNLFIHYHPVLPGPQPAAGKESNAFPEIIIGDFGESALVTDYPGNLKHGPLRTDRVATWEDVYSMGAVLRELCQAHIPHDDPMEERPNSIRSADINSHIPGGELQYSEALIELLRMFEWPGSDNEGSEITDPAQNEDTGEYMYNDNGNQLFNYDYLPTAQFVSERVVDGLRQILRNFRGVGVEVPADYFTSLDVSWTRPNRVMPYTYLPPRPEPENAPDDYRDGEPEDVEDEETGEARRRCPTPDNERKLREIISWEDRRPAHRVVSLSYNVPAMEQVRENPGPVPYPGPPPRASN